jgi:cytosine/adenosine deaminase-related metal-dependent hydrolase
MISLTSNQTTTSCYYATLHLEATKVLADLAGSLGQRAFIGVSVQSMPQPTSTLNDLRNAT